MYEQMDAIQQKASSEIKFRIENVKQMLKSENPEASEEEIEETAAEVRKSLIAPDVWTRCDTATKTLVEQVLVENYLQAFGRSGKGVETEAGSFKIFIRAAGPIVGDILSIFAQSSQQLRWAKIWRQEDELMTDPDDGSDVHVKHGLSKMLEETKIDDAEDQLFDHAPTKDGEWKLAPAMYMVPGHGMQVVAFDNKKNLLVKNSWGTKETKTVYGSMEAEFVKTILDTPHYETDTGSLAFEKLRLQSSRVEVLTHVMTEDGEQFDSNLENKLIEAANKGETIIYAAETKDFFHGAQTDSVNLSSKVKISVSDPSAQKSLDEIRDKIQVHKDLKWGESSSKHAGYLQVSWVDVARASASFYDGFAQFVWLPDMMHN